MFLLIGTTFGIQLYKTGIIRKGVEPIWENDYKFFTDSMDGDIKITLCTLKKSKRIKIGKGIFNLSNLTHERNYIGLDIVFDDPSLITTQREDASLRFKVNLAVCYISESKKEEKIINFEDAYVLGKELGAGATATVFKAVKRDTLEEFAVKRLNTKALDQRAVEKLKSEIEIMSKLKSSYIIELFEHYQDADYVYMTQELAKHGELFDYVADRGHLPELEGSTVITQILKGVRYLHLKGIAHRDLKLENILVTDTENLTVKISDFGLSKNFSDGILSTACGTPEYVAPEVLLSVPYDQSADIWSIGVITFMILSGKPPFYGADNHEIFSRILANDYHFMGRVWRNVSRNAKQFIEALLASDPEERPTAVQCLTAPWFTKMESQRKKDKLEINFYNSINTAFTE
eukprot:TRINITY_DN509_c0_g1_i2.p1 TRINITY_DN509_c0_g1~~TRINITY_DN509_c0_g1_i2.p1  ORF type:complete len:404 (+),score=80.43 TRINITY_DN509_c0_g1_i2:517-1728(+)